MAGPLSSEEIEDVVSSVRRLVSNEQRVKTRDLTAERLVLTSNFRVMPETSPLSPVSALSPLMLDAPLVEAPPEPEPEVLEVLDVVKDVLVPQSVDPLEDSLAQALDAAPEVTGQDDGHGAVVTPVVTPEAAPEAPFADTVEAEWEDEIWTEPGQVSLGEAALAAEEAEVLTAPEPEPEPEQEPQPQPEADSIAAEASDAAAAVQPEAADNDLTEDPIPFVPLRRRAEDLAARVAAGAVAELPADPEPERPDPMDKAHAVDPGPADGTPAADPAQMATDLYDADGTPLAVLDEAALNEIVRQVLRAELQGELGERITRNVRKLVRAEINRALMARDLD